jgi:hypothetical protein
MDEQTEIVHGYRYRPKRGGFLLNEHMGVIAISPLIRGHPPKAQTSSFPKADS